MAEAASRWRPPEEKYWGARPHLADQGRHPPGHHARSCPVIFGSLQDKGGSPLVRWWHTPRRWTSRTPWPTTPHGELCGEPKDDAPSPPSSQIMTDPSWAVAFLRVYSGSPRAATPSLNAARDEERIGGSEDARQQARGDQGRLRGRHRGRGGPEKGPLGHHNPNQKAVVLGRPLPATVLARPGDQDQGRQEKPARAGQMRRTNIQGETDRDTARPR